MGIYLTGCLSVILVLAAGIAGYMWWQASIKPAPYEVMFEVRPGEPVMRRTVKLVDGRAMEIDGRIIPLEGAANFRDLGGYDTADGRRTAWGKLYRADELYELTEADRMLIRDLGIRLVCDLRSYPETRRRPDRLPEGIEYRHMPIFPKDPIGRLRVLFLRHRLDRTFKRMYRDSIIDAGAPALGGLLRLAADPANLPMVYHCTGGKDRTGIATALLLHAAGVPRATIISDYTLTNLAIERFLGTIRKAMTAVTPPPGLRLEQLYPLFSARPELIEHAFEHIESTYGSVDAYLRGAAGLSEAELQAIRENLLEE